MSRRPISTLPDRLFPPFYDESRTALSLPFAFAKCGIFNAITLLVVVATTTYASLIFLTTLSRKLKAASLSEIVDKTLGANYRRFITFNLIFVLMFSLVGFEILIKSVCKDVIGYFDVATNVRLYEDASFILIFFMAFPLCLFESLHNLRYTCQLGFAAIMVVIIALVCKLVNGSNYDVASSKYLIHANDFVWSDFMEGAPIICLVYFCQFNVLGVYSQLKNPTDDNVNATIRDAMIVVTIFYVTLGAAGCFMFPKDMYGVEADNILTIFSDTSVPILCGRIAILITLTCSLPVIVIPLRMIIFVEVIGSLHFNCLARDLSNFLENLNDDDAIDYEQSIGGDVKVVAREPSLRSPVDDNNASRHRVSSDGDIISHILHLKRHCLPQIQWRSEWRGYEEIDGYEPVQHVYNEEESKILSKSSMVLVPSGIEASWREFRSGHNDSSTTTDEDKTCNIDEETQYIQNEEIKQSPFNLMSVTKNIRAPHTQLPSLSLSPPASVRGTNTSSLPHCQSYRPFDRIFELQELQRIPSVNILTLSGSPHSPDSALSRSQPQHISLQSRELSSSSLYFVKFGVTVMIFLASIFPALYIPGVSNVWTIIGSLIFPVVAFIMPSASYLTFCNTKNLTIDCNYILSFIILAVAGVSTVLLTTQNIVFSYLFRHASQTP